MQRIMIGAGGTGGHVYPALAAAEALSATSELTFVGTVGGGGMERRLVEASGINFAAYEEVPAGPIVGVNPLRTLGSGIKMSAGTLKAWRFLGRHRPQAILLTGGWANVPLALAAAARRIPFCIYLPDIEPGATIRVLKRLAAKVAITVPDAAQHFRAGQTVVTGYPLGTRITRATREAAFAHFGLQEGYKTLLVFGGSRGARNINIALENSLDDLLREDVQIIHVTGTLDWERSQANVKAHPRYHPYAYLDTMGLAFAAADIAICRSGASTLGELPYFGIASVLVPYPYAWRYQKTNADFLVQHGAALRVDDERMAEELLPALRGLLQDDGRLNTMQHNARTLSPGESAVKLAQVLQNLAGG